MLCWSIWKHINELVWQAKIPVMNEVVTFAKLNFVDWRNAQKMYSISAQIREANREEKEHWTTPNFLTIKVNVDGAISDNDGRYGFGMVARSSAGLVLSAQITSRKVSCHLIL